jgi:vacuolar-type H+-ATPase subunit H
MDNVSQTIAIIASVVIIFSAQTAWILYAFAQVNKRIDELKDDVTKHVDEMRSDVHKRIDEVKDDVTKHVDEMRSDVNKRIDEVRGEVKEARDEMKGMFAEIRTSLEDLKTEIVRDHGERIAKLEERIIRHS